MNAFAITIRPEYLEICEGDHCAAAILDLFGRWTFGKEKRGASTWVYKKRTELRDDLMGLFGLSKVAAALIKLRAWGYLNWRENPVNRQDKTLQYQFNQAAVYAVLRLLDQSSVAQNEGSERLNLTAGELETSASLTDSLAERLAAHLTEPPPTPARAGVGGGVKNRLPPVSIDSILDHPNRAETPTEADEHEPATFAGTPDTATGERTPLMARVPPCPTGDETTEIDTVSSGDTKPVDVPEWANEINEPADVIAKMFTEHGLELTGWYEYGRKQASVTNPVGLARAKVRQGLKPPIDNRHYKPTGESYITGELADFIEH